MMIRMSVMDSMGSSNKIESSSKKKVQKRTIRMNVMDSLKKQRRAEVLESSSKKKKQKCNGIYGSSSEKYSM